MDAFMMLNRYIFFVRELANQILVHSHFGSFWPAGGCGFIAILGALNIAFQLTAADSHIADARTWAFQEVQLV